VNLICRNCKGDDIQSIVDDLSENSRSSIEVGEAVFEKEGQTMKLLKLAQMKAHRISFKVKRQDSLLTLDLLPTPFLRASSPR